MICVVTVEILGTYLELEQCFWRVEFYPKSLAVGRVHTGETSLQLIELYSDTHKHRHRYEQGTVANEELFQQEHRFTTHKLLLGKQVTLF